MRVSYGYGGWVRVDGFGLPGPLYVRFAPDDQERWRVIELYIDGDGQPLSTAMLRHIRIDQLEALVPSYGNLPKLSGIPGPDLHRLAAFYVTRFGPAMYDGHHCDNCGGPLKGSRVRRQDGRPVALQHWVAESWLAQYEDSGIRQIEPREPRQWRDPQSEELPVIEPPAGRRMTDDFLQTVAHAYALAVAKGLPPAPTIGARTNTSNRTVHKWIRTARQRGIMPPGTRGRVG
jgi:hypothetical protein